MDEKADSIIALRELPGVGERILARLLEVAERRGEPLQRILDASPPRMAAVYGLPAPAIARLCEQRDRHLRRCAWLSGELRRAGAAVLLRGSPGYPSVLEAGLDHPPPMLFAFGSHSILTSPRIALLSSREVGDETVPAIVALLRRARRQGLAAVIGGMKTTHRLAAITARALGVARIVVLDRGLLSAFAGGFAIDPFGAGDSRAPFDGARTLVLSPFRPQDHAAPNSGRRRDQMVAALGDVLFASSARPAGEVERICLAALRRGKRVLVWRDANRALVTAGAMPLSPDNLAATLRELFAGGR